MAVLALFPLGKSVTGALHTIKQIRGAGGNPHAPSWFSDYVIVHATLVLVATCIVVIAMFVATAAPKGLADASSAPRLRARVWCCCGVLPVALLAFGIEVTAAAQPTGQIAPHVALVQLLNLAAVSIGVVLYLSYLRPNLLGVLWHASRPLRLETITVGVFTAVLLFAPVTPDQTLDAMRAWASAAWSVPLFALAGAVLFGLVLHESSLLMVLPQTQKPVPRVPYSKGWSQVEERLARASHSQRAVPPLAMMVAGAALYGVWMRAYVALWGVAAVLLWFAVYLWVLPKLRNDEEVLKHPDEWVPYHVYRVLAVWPIVIVLGSLLRAGGDYLLLGAIDVASVFRLALIAVLLIAAVVLLGEFGTIKRGTTAGERESDFTLDIAMHQPIGLRDCSRYWSTTTLAVEAVAGLGVAVWIGRWAETLLAVLIVAALGFYLTQRRHWFGSLPYGLALPAARAWGIALLIGVTWKPHEVADMFGTVGLVLFAFAAGLAALHLMMRTFYTNGFREGSRPARYGVTRVPVLTLVLAWFVVAFVAAPETAHSVRETSLKTPVGNPPTLGDVFETWTRSQPELQGGAQSSRTVPLILLASHGGGIRATYWTDLVLDCLVREHAGACPAQPTSDGHPVSPGDARGQATIARRVFLASGVSGGGVGLAEYATELFAEGALEPGWVHARAGQDFVSAPAGYGLFHDLPGFLIGLHPPARYSCGSGVAGVPEAFRPCLLLRDRASVLEEEMDQASASAAGEQPLLRRVWSERENANPAGSAPTPSRADLVPLLVTNSTIDGAGDRLLVSAANLANPERRDAATTALARSTDSCPARGSTVADTTAVPSARDVTDVVPNRERDLRLVTAAFLGARFPIIGTSGRLQSAGCSVSAADGGYLDNSGLLTISAVMPRLKQLVKSYNMANGGADIQIVLIDIDDHFDSDYALAKPTGGPGRVRVAPAANLQGRGDYIERLGRESAYVQIPANCEVSVRPHAHVGASAPLGWTLSDATMKDMQQSLTQLGDEVRLASRLVRSGCPDHE